MQVSRQLGWLAGSVRFSACHDAIRLAAKVSPIRNSADLSHPVPAVPLCCVAGLLRFQRVSTTRTKTRTLQEQSVVAELAAGCRRRCPSLSVPWKAGISSSTLRTQEGQPGPKLRSLCFTEPSLSSTVGMAGCDQPRNAIGFLYLGFSMLL